MMTKLASSLRLGSAVLGPVGTLLASCTPRVRPRRRPRGDRPRARQMEFCTDYAARVSAVARGGTIEATRPNWRATWRDGCGCRRAAAVDDCCARRGRRRGTRRAVRALLSARLKRCVPAGPDPAAFASAAQRGGRRASRRRRHALARGRAHMPPATRGPTVAGPPGESRPAGRGLARGEVEAGRRGRLAIHAEPAATSRRAGGEMTGSGSHHAIARCRPVPRGPPTARSAPTLHGREDASFHRLRSLQLTCARGPMPRRSHTVTGSRDHPLERRSSSSSPARPESAGAASARRLLHPDFPASRRVACRGPRDDRGAWPPTPGPVDGYEVDARESPPASCSSPTAPRTAPHRSGRGRTAGRCLHREAHPYLP